ncbi:MAG: asparagine synthase C-terminal domain-containing protein [Nanoarchaeota archaeon]|nr:asparagine synthase C-terminal domain-containing protein [Nanoarchaeota archaeon]
MEMQGIIENKKLISQDEWRKYINSLKTEKIENNKEKCRELVKESLVTSIKKRTINLKKFGILFSGGIDSSIIALICKKLGLNFKCYAIGLKNSKDLEWAERTALALNLKLKTITLELDETEKIIKRVIKILKQTDVISVGVGSVIYAGIKLSKKDSINTLFTGTGSDELFAGYSRFENIKGINRECWSSLNNLFKDLKRDFLIAKSQKAGLITPFLDEKVIKSAMEVPEKYKLNKNIRKYILREIAVDLGLPKEFAFRKKTAAQYGSGIDKAIKKLAKKNNFKYKKDYLKSLS